MKRFDLISPRVRKDKTYWQKIGVAFPRDQGGFQLLFDALPLPDAEGRCMVLMSEPRDTQDDYREKRATNTLPDDSIPF